MDNLSKLESTSKVVSRSLHEGVYTSLSKINQNGYADWNSSLTGIFNSAKQIDALYQEVDPKLSLFVPVPRQNAVYGESTIPQLLSTAMANDETSCIEKPNPKYMNIPSDWDNIHNHNDNVEDILENFTNAVDKWKENYKNKGKKVIPK